MSENKQVQALRHKIIEYGTLRGAMSINQGTYLFRENLDAAEKLFREIEADLAVLSESAGEKIDLDKLRLDVKNKLCTDGHLNVAHASIMRSDTPDGKFCIIGNLARSAVDMSFDAIRATNIMQSTKEEK